MNVRTRLTEPLVLEHEQNTTAFPRDPVDVTPPHRRRLFTLIEVLVAIGLLGVIIAALFMGTHVVLTTWERLETHNSDFQDLLVLDRTLDSILSNAVPFRWPTDVERPRDELYIQFRGETDTLIVPTLHRVNSIDDGGIRFCGLFLENDEFVVYYCLRPPFPDDLDSERLRRTVLSRNVTKLGFLYADWQDGDIVFVDDWEARDYMPLAILVQLEWADGSSENWLRRTAASGYYESWGRRNTDAERTL